MSDAADMHPIMAAVRGYLDRINAGDEDAPAMSEEVLDAAAAAFRAALDRQFNSRRGKGGFRYRLSNIGHPFCKLWHEKAGTPGEPRPYNHPIKMMVGDAIEAIAVAVMKTAGVPIEAEGERASLRLDVGPDEAVVVHGTTDVEIAGKVWDIKSASSWAFREKFTPPHGWDKLRREDDFGYLAQLFGYARGRCKAPGGWIAVNRETGEFSVLEAPKGEALREARAEALGKARETLRKLEAGAEFERCFEDVPEKFRGRTTGDRVLGTACRWCEFKWTCWPGLSHERSRASLSWSAPFVHYTTPDRLGKKEAA